MTQMINMRDMYKAMTKPEISFRTLHLLPKLDRYGNLLTYASNNALITKAYLNATLVAVKCYVSPRENICKILADDTVISSPLLVPSHLYKEEFIVTLSNGAESYHDVVIAPWASGGTLDEAILSAVRDKDRATLANLAERFDRFALSLLDAPFAHGDLKPENIVITEDGEFRLIDLDALWTPALTRCEELGTAEYQHPMRDAQFFGPHIDDYPIALISVALHSLAELPDIADGGALLPFDSSLVRGGNEAYNIAVAHFRKSGNLALLRLAEQLTNRAPILTGLREMIVELNEERDDEREADINTDYQCYRE